MKFRVEKKGRPVCKSSKKGTREDRLETWMLPKRRRIFLVKDQVQKNSKRDASARIGNFSTSAGTW